MDRIFRETTPTRAAVVMEEEEVEEGIRRRMEIPAGRRSIAARSIETRRIKGRPYCYPIIGDIISAVWILD